MGTMGHTSAPTKKGVIRKYDASLIPCVLIFFKLSSQIIWTFYLLKILRFNFPQFDNFG
jgi:hypothetical protein